MLIPPLPLLPDRLGFSPMGQHRKVLPNQRKTRMVAMDRRAVRWGIHSVFISLNCSKVLVNKKPPLPSAKPKLYKPTPTLWKPESGFDQAKKAAEEKAKKIMEEAMKTRPPKPVS